MYLLSCMDAVIGTSWNSGTRSGDIFLYVKGLAISHPTCLGLNSSEIQPWLLNSVFHKSFEISIASSNLDFFFYLKADSDSMPAASYRLQGMRDGCMAPISRLLLCPNWWSRGVKVASNLNVSQGIEWKVKWGERNTRKAHPTPADLSQQPVICHWCLDWL